MSPNFKHSMSLDCLYGDKDPTCTSVHCDDFPEICCETCYIPPDIGELNLCLLIINNLNLTYLNRKQFIKYMVLIV